MIVTWLYDHVNFILNHNVILTTLLQSVDVGVLIVNCAPLDVFYHATKKDVKFVNVKMKVLVIHDIVILQ